MIDLAEDIKCADICVPLKDIFYVTDLVVLNKDFANKLIDNRLQETFLMVRGYHQPKYYEGNLDSD